MELRLSILGSLAVYLDGESLRVAGARRRALLARLLVSANQRVEVEALLEDCWDTHVSPAARATLASHVSQLRKLIGPERLKGGDGGYLLRVKEGESEADCFTGELAEGRRLLAAGEPAAALGLLETALGRWRGPALAGFADRRWAAPEVARLGELRELAGEARIEAVLASGDHEAAAALAEAAVREQPLREQRWLQLMLALYRCGRQAEALQAYRRARAVLVEQLGIDPSGELAALEGAILRRQPVLAWQEPRPIRHGASVDIPPAAPSGQPPLPRTPFVGRQFELIKLTAELSQDRLVTLVGPGGVGKTRLALEGARSAKEQLRDGCVWVNLARFENAHEMAAAIATALNLPPPQDGDFVAALAVRLSSAEQLLVLDDCEHLLEPVAELVDRLLASCPSLTLLATSREPLAVPGETVWPLGPLELEASVELFEQRALAADAVLELDDEDRALVAAICERAERLPLAIEIAAAHTRTLALAEIARKLPERFPSQLARWFPARQRGLPATIDWSWRLLESAEQQLFAELSIFPASFDLLAAEAICTPSAPPGTTLRSLGRLVDASLLAADRGGVRTRYRMLQPVRQFARRQADEAGISADLQRRHCRHFAQVARELAAATTAPGPNDVARRFDEEWDNLRAAVVFALEARDLDHVVALVAGSGLWALHGMRSEHADWTRRALELAAQLRRPKASLYAIAAEWAYWADRRNQAIQLAHEAVRLAPQASIEATAAWIRIGYSHARMDDYQHATAAFAQAERALAHCDDPFTFVAGHAIVHGVLAVLCPGQREQHIRMLRRAAAELDNPLADALVGRTIVSDRLIAGAIDEAIIELQPALEAAHTAGAIGLETDLIVLGLAPLPLSNNNPPGNLGDTIARLKTTGYTQLIDIALEILAVLWARDGHTDLAALLLGYLEVQGPLYQHPFWVTLRAAHLEPIRMEPKFAGEIARGADMNQAKVLDLVLAQLATDQPFGSANKPTGDDRQIGRTV